MSGTRRGLVAPQNTFLENIIRRYNGQHNSFILANARIYEYPIIYCNDGFFKLTGFNRAEVMQRSCLCQFMWFSAINKSESQSNWINITKGINNKSMSSSASLSSSSSTTMIAQSKENNSDSSINDAMTRLKSAMDKHEPIKLDVQLYKKNKELLQLVIEEYPIKNENRTVIFFLLTFIDLSSLRQQPEPDSKFVTFARLARLIAKQKQTNLPNVSSNNNSSNISCASNVIVNKSITINEKINSNKDFSQKADQLVSIISLHSELLPQYKQEAPKTPPDILLHYSPFKTFWDWIILLLTGYTAVMVPFNVAFNSTALENIVILVVDNVVDVFFFIDIILNFHTTFVGPSGEVISDSTIIRINYLKGWFLIDLLSCLPYDVFNAFEPETNEARGVSQLFGALKVVRLLRLGRVLRKMDQYMEYMATILALMMFGFLLLAHWLACGWFSIGIDDINNKIYYGWLVKMLQDNGQVINKSRDSNFTFPKSNITQSYVTSLYFTLTLLTTIGFGNVSANTILEKWICIFFMLIGALVYAVIFGNVTTIFQQFYATRARYQEMMKNVKDFMSVHEIPRQLSERVIDYITSSWVITKGIDTQLVLNYCPKDMKADLCIHMNRDVFNEHPAFRLASDGCLRALAVEFYTIHSAPGDLIYHQGESIEQLSFVVSGSLEIIQDGEIVAILGKGDVFGDNFWKETTVGQSAATVRALTYCDLHSIRREKLLAVLKFYHAFGNSFSRNLILTFNLRNRIIFRTLDDANREKQLQQAVGQKESRATSKIESNLLSSSHSNNSMNRLIAKFKRLNSNNSNNDNVPVSSKDIPSFTEPNFNNKIMMDSYKTGSQISLVVKKPSITNLSEIQSAIATTSIDNELEPHFSIASSSSISKIAETPRVHFMKVNNITESEGNENELKDNVDLKETLDRKESLESKERQDINSELCGYHIDYINKLVVELKSEMKLKLMELDDKANNIENKVTLLYNHLMLLSN